MQTSQELINTTKSIQLFFPEGEVAPPSPEVEYSQSLGLPFQANVHAERPISYRYHDCEIDPDRSRLYFLKQALPEKCAPADFRKKIPGEVLSHWNTVSKEPFDRFEIWSGSWRKGGTHAALVGYANGRSFLLARWCNAELPPLEEVRQRAKQEREKAHEAAATVFGDRLFVLYLAVMGSAFAGLVYVSYGVLSYGGGTTLFVALVLMAGHVLLVRSFINHVVVLLRIERLRWKDDLYRACQ